MVEWHVNSYLGVFWSAIVLPLMLLGAKLFHSRRRAAFIRARQPKLVLIIVFVLMLWTLFLSLQRIYSEVFPCWLTLWGGYLGVILLLNLFMVRGAALYINFNLTRRMLEDEERARARNRHERLAERASVLSLSGFQDTTDKIKVRKSWWRLHAKLLRGSRLGLVCLVMTVLLTIPATVVTATSETLRTFKGDGCLLYWEGSALALSLFVGVYALFFLVLARRMNSFSEAFKLKQELALCGLVGVLFLPPWYVLNNFETVNDSLVDVDTFPWSTFVLLVGVFAVYFIIVPLPLWRSYQKPPELTLETPDAIKDYSSMMQSDRARTVFGLFLQEQFAVENILFWQAVQDLRDLVRDALRETQSTRLLLAARGCSEQALRIFDMYVSEESRKQVNLKARNLERCKERRAQLVEVMDEVVRQHETATPSQSAIKQEGGHHRRWRTLTRKLRLSTRLDEDDEHEQCSSAEVAQSTAVMQQAPGRLGRSPTLVLVGDQRNVGTVFSLCEHMYSESVIEINDLMASDLYPRFIYSNLYKDLVTELQATGEQRTMLIEIGVLSDDDRDDSASSASERSA
ncbi:MAG: hypothetical protein MHM6MM_006110 [Cercozoa sp. M6MM]